MSVLETRPLGRTGIPVTRLGYGALEISGPRRGGRDIPDDHIRSVLHATLDAGVNFIDTAPDYGRSEALIGEFLRMRRSEYALATKCGCRVVSAGDRDQSAHVWTRDQLLWNIDDSLGKLQTDYVDLLQLHNATASNVEDGKLIDVLLEIKAAGKASWLGVSSVLPSLSTYIDWGVFDAFQIPYSALDRRHEHLITRAHGAGIGTIIRGAVSRIESGSAGNVRTLWEHAKLDELMEEGLSRTQWLLRFTLSHPGVDTAIVGTASGAHLADNVRAANLGPLPEDVYQEAKRRLDAAGERPLEI